jgi:hypothetical protein
MNIARRHLLFGAVSFATAGSQCVRDDASATRVSQQELDEAIRLHGMWLTDMHTCPCRKPNPADN